MKRRVGEQLNCPGDVEADDIAACLRLRNVDELLEVRLDVPRFTSGFAPFVDGTILPASSTNQVYIQFTHMSISFLALYMPHY